MVLIRCVIDKRGLLSQDLNINVSTDLLQHVNMTDMSLRRDMRLLSPDMANSTLCDVTDLSQKLDFSVLCQHSTSCLYVMGGYIEDSQHFIEKYDTQKGKWEIAGTFVNNRTKFSCMALPESGIILIMGGKQVLYNYIIVLISIRMDIEQQNVSSIL